MPITISRSPTPAYRKVMYFIDGGYLRSSLKSMRGGDSFNITSLPYNLNTEFFGGGRIQGEIVRVHYYDAIYDPKEPEYDDQKLYFDGLDSQPFVEVRLGSIVKGEKESRQKGVDVLMAIDMVTKGYENHYDIAIIIAGDGDFEPLIRAVKSSTGKRVFGVVFDEHYSMKLYRQFDKGLVIDSTNVDRFL